MESQIKTCSFEDPSNGDVAGQGDARRQQTFVLQYVAQCDDAADMAEEIRWQGDIDDKRSFLEKRVVDSLHAQEMSSPSNEAADSDVLEHKRVMIDGPLDRFNKDCKQLPMRSNPFGLNLNHTCTKSAFQDDNLDKTDSRDKAHASSTAAEHLPVEEGLESSIFDAMHRKETASRPTYLCCLEGEKTIETQQKVNSIRSVDELNVENRDLHSPDVVRSVDDEIPQSIPFESSKPSKEESNGYSMTFSIKSSVPGGDMLQTLPNNNEEYGSADHEICVKVTIINRDCPQQIMSSVQSRSVTPLLERHHKNGKSNMTAGVGGTAELSKEGSRKDHSATQCNSVESSDTSIPRDVSSLEALIPFIRWTKNDNGNHMKDSQRKTSEGDNERIPLQEWFGSLYDESWSLRAGSEVKLVFALTSSLLDGASDFLVETSSNATQEHEDSALSAKRPFRSNDILSRESLSDPSCQCASKAINEATAAMLASETIHETTISGEKSQASLGDGIDSQRTVSENKDESAGVVQVNETDRLALSFSTELCQSSTINKSFFMPKERRKLTFDGIQSEEADSSSTTWDRAAHHHETSAKPGNVKHGSQQDSQTNWSDQQECGSLGDMGQRAKSLSTRNDGCSPHSAHSRERNCQRQKCFHPIRLPFPSTKERRRSYNQGPSFPGNDMYAQKALPQGIEKNATIRPISKWFSVRRLRTSVQRKRKSRTKTVPVAGKSEAMVDLEPVVSIQTPDLKKSVRFKDTLTEVHTFKQMEDFDDDESQSLFNYYYEFLTSRDTDWSHEELLVDDDSFGGASVDAAENNKCFLDVAAMNHCHAFAPMAEVDEAYDDEAYDDDDSIREPDSQSCQEALH